MSVEIAGTGSYLPEKILTNDELVGMLETSDEWIVSHTGIRTRHIAAENENTSDMAFHAAQRALEAAHVQPEELGGIVVATSTPDYRAFPSVACQIQGRLGCGPIAAFDICAACSGCIYAIRTAAALMASDPRPYLVVGAETMSRTLDYADRNTCIIFGDGAGALVLKHSEEAGRGILECILGSNGSADPPVIYRTGGARRIEGEPVEGRFHMNGRATFNFAVKIFDDLISQLLTSQRKTFGELKLVVPHQANARIIEAVARRVEQPLEKFFMNIAEVGNTSAASVFIALDEAVRQGKIVRDDLVALVAFGAGLAYGGMLLKW